ncbi:hypothetical protein VTO73DRAFT_10270 [Trametes versicolor]
MLQGHWGIILDYLTRMLPGDRLTDGGGLKYEVKALAEFQNGTGTRPDFLVNLGHNNKSVMSTFAVEVKCEPVLEAARNDIEDVLSGRTQIDWQKQVAANRLNDGQRIFVQVHHQLHQRAVAAVILVRDNTVYVFEAAPQSQPVEGPEEADGREGAAGLQLQLGMTDCVSQDGADDREVEALLLQPDETVPISPLVDDSDPSEDVSTDSDLTDSDLTDSDLTDSDHTNELIFEIQTQTRLACLGVARPISTAQTRTGVKDKITCYWIDKLLERSRARKDAQPNISAEDLVTDGMAWHGMASITDITPI